MSSEDVFWGKGLAKSYNTRKVVNDVEIAVTAGEVVGLLGPNGAGKTTTFYMMVGLVQPDAGDIYITEDRVTELPMYERARRGISYLPQEPSVFRKLSVYDNILSVVEILPAFRGDRQKQRAKVDELLAELNLQKVAESKAFSLSGGERRRVEIARALACSPKFMLLDEPFAGIDPIVVGDLQKLVRHLRGKGIGILITDHNVRETLGICDRAYILTEGKVIETGTPQQIASSELARRYYLGEGFSLS